MFDVELFDDEFFVFVGGDEYFDFEDDEFRNKSCGDRLCMILLVFVFFKKIDVIIRGVVVKRMFVKKMRRCSRSDDELEDEGEV